MKIWSVALGILLFLALLTWLLLRGAETNAPAYEVTLKAFDDFALAEASLQRDVVEARSGLLRDYDPLVRAIAAIRDALARLRSYAQTGRLDTEPVDRLAALVAEQEQLAERFKSNNALLQNSLSYIGLLSTGPIFGGEESRLAPATGAIAAALLNLRRDTSADAVKALQERIDRFAAQAPTTGPDAEAAQALLAHARLLHDLLPSIDATLRSFFEWTGQPALQDTRALFARHQAVVEAKGQRSRLLLYFVSILLLAFLVSLAQLLRGRAVALGRRAAFEHAIAQNSTRLINCPPDETEARLQQVLGELGRAIALERVYVVLDRNPVRAYAWCADGAAYGPGWPDRVLALAAQLGATGPDIITVPDVAGLTSGDLKDGLSAAGVRAWVCVPLIQSGKVRGIMGFDAFHPLRSGWEGILPPPVLRLAGDAVSNAIEREFLERDRERLTTRLERARRMQMVGSLASGIAHNFNNIIAAILGFSEMVEPELAAGTKPALHVDEIRRAAERGRDLVDNILTFGRRRDARVRPVQVSALFEEAASLLRASLPGEIEVVVDNVPAAAAVSGEPAQLQQVILNLCTNAAQAMHGSGSIRVTAEQRDLRAGLSLSHGELPPGRYVCLAVIDTGRGFDDAVAQRLFEPFFTTRSAGTGLGLATAREIVRDHEGAINVQSRPGHGSRFEVWLPAAREGGPANAGQELLPLGHGETVLIVEGEPERLLRDEEMLAALGYEPVGFQLPADALAAYTATPGRFDFILIHHAPKTQGGLELARALHELAPRQPLILAAASTVDISIDALAEAGISEVLRSPLSSTELAAALARRTSDVDEREALRARQAD
jgi:signal transduction histidine kinase/AmiR/NasT family two-component response regulator